MNDYEKMDEQKDIISYLSVGAEKEFSFIGVAFYYGEAGVTPDLPTEPLEIEIEIVSFEKVIE